MIRTARVLAYVVLAFLMISFVIGLASRTGFVERAALVVLIGGCIYAAAKISTLTDWAVQRLARHS